MPVPLSKLLFILQVPDTLTSVLIVINISDLILTFEQNVIEAESPVSSTTKTDITVTKITTVFIVINFQVNGLDKPSVRQNLYQTLQRFCTYRNHQRLKCIHADHVTVSSIFKPLSKLLAEKYK